MSIELAWNGIIVNIVLKDYDEIFHIYVSKYYSILPYYSRFFKTIKQNIDNWSFCLYPYLLLVSPFLPSVNHSSKDGACLSCPCFLHNTYI